MAKAKSPKDLSYEQAFKELEAIVQSLQSGELPLEEALALFERGQALSARCNELLESAEIKIRQLVPDDKGSYREVDADLVGDTQ